jgi:hypothetical protein
MMLRLVHFAGNTNLAGDMFGTLRGGMQPVFSHLPSPGFGRHDMAREAGEGAPPAQEPEPARSISAADVSGAPGAAGTASAGEAAAAGIATGSPIATATLLTVEKSGDALDSVGDTTTQFTDTAMPGPPAPSGSTDERPNDHEEDL